MLSHAPRHLPPWLIFDVRQKCHMQTENQSTREDPRAWCPGDFRKLSIVLCGAAWLFMWFSSVIDRPDLIGPTAPLHLFFPSLYLLDIIHSQAITARSSALSKMLFFQTCIPVVALVSIAIIAVAKKDMLSEATLISLFAAALGYTSFLATRKRKADQDSEEA